VNATTHGLRASGILLAAEDEAAYVAHLEGVLVAIEPVGEAETHAALMLADLQWRQRQWLRALDAATVDNLEERVKHSPEHAQMARIDVALVVVKEMIDAMACHDGDYVPAAIEALVSAVRAMLPILREAGNPTTTSVAALRGAMEQLEHAATVEETKDAIAMLNSAGAALHTALTQQAQEAKACVDRVERALSAVPSDDDAKSLARYGRLIDVAVENQLRTLDTLQRRRQQAERRAKGQPKSFGREVAPSEVRLRIVR
jgi:hypothetical protein